MLSSADTARAHALSPTAGLGRGLDRHLEYDAMVGDGTMLMRSRHPELPGALLAGFWCKGPDWESMSTSQVRAFIQGLESALMQIEYGWMLHFEVIRRVEHRYQRAVFPEAIDAVIDRERARSAYHYITQRGLFLSQAPGFFERRFARTLRHVLLGPSEGAALDAHAERVGRFDEQVDAIGEAFARAGITMHRMRGGTSNDELFQALNLCVNGAWHPCVLPDVPVHMNEALAREMRWTPRTMQHAGAHVAVVGVKRYPTRCAPLLLRELSLLNAEVRWSTRFIPLDHARNERLFGALQRAWVQQILPFFAKTLNVGGIANKNAIEKAREVSEAIREMESRKVRYGLFTTVLIFRGKTQREADANAKKAIDVLTARGFNACVEEENKVAAWHGSLPGTGGPNARRPPMHTGHVARLISLTDEYAGEDRHPCPLYPPKAPPLMQVRNWSGGVFRLNLHEPGSSLGHTAVLGPSQMGKTFALAYLVSQFLKYEGAQVFCVDVGRNMLALTLAHRSGRFYQLGGEQGVRLCPLGDELDTVEGRAWACVWLKELFEHQGVVVDDRKAARITAAVENLAAASSGPADRTLTHLSPHLLGSGLEQALAYYTVGPGAEVLNGGHASLERARLTTFELSALPQYGKAVAEPAKAVMWRLIHKSRDGRPTLVVVDEFTVALPEQRDQKKFRDDLNTSAKLNCVYVFATQQLDQLLTSELASVVTSGCPTKLLLPNPGMDDTLRALYANRLSMTDTQVELVKRIRPRAQLMVLQQGGTLQQTMARVVSLDAGPVAKAFFGARSADELRAILQLVEEHGQEEWPEAWLRHFGQHDAAAAFRRHRELPAGEVLL